MTNSVNVGMGERVRGLVWRTGRKLFTSSVVAQILRGLLVREGSWCPVVVVSKLVWGRRKMEEAFPTFSSGQEPSWGQQLVLCCQWEISVGEGLVMGLRWVPLPDSSSWATWEPYDFSRSFIITLVSREMFGAVPSIGLSCSSSVSSFLVFWWGIGQLMALLKCVRSSC